MQLGKNCSQRSKSLYPYSSHYAFNPNPLSSFQNCPSSLTPVFSPTRQRRILYGVPRTENVRHVLSQRKLELPPTTNDHSPIRTHGSHASKKIVQDHYEEFKINPLTVIVWTDSMIVLAWLRSESTLLNQFAQSTSKLSKTSLLNHFSTPCDALQKTTEGLRRSSPTIGHLSSELRMSFEICTKKGNDVLKISLQVIK